MHKYISYNFVIFFLVKSNKKYRITLNISRNSATVSDFFFFIYISEKRPEKRYPKKRKKTLTSERQLLSDFFFFFSLKYPILETNTRGKKKHRQKKL